MPDSGSSSGLSDEPSAKKDQIVDVKATLLLKLNEFLCASGKGPVAKPKKGDWEYLSVRTKNDRVSKAKDVIVATMEVICPKDPGSLWEALKSSKKVEKALKIDQYFSDTKYLNALADSYDHATGWDTRRQVLSVMADLVPYHIIQLHLPGMNCSSLFNAAVV